MMNEHSAAAPAPPASDPPMLRIRMLGTFSVSAGNREVPDSVWRLSKARNLLKLLALAPEHRLHREQVLDLLWSDLELSAAKNNLHQALHNARKALELVLPGIDGKDVLVLRRQVLELAPALPLWIDAEAFAVAARRALASDLPADCYAALDLYGGDLLLEDRFDDWTRERRDSLREQQLQLLLRLASLQECYGEPTLAIDALRRVIAADSAREDAYVSLMRLYALAERQSQALRLYERLREVLEEEFDAEPAAETSRLYRSILDRRFPPPGRAAPAQPAAVEPADVPVAAVAARQPSPFINRTRELGMLAAGLAEAIAGRGQAILLTGEPGIGKTRLAEEATRLARERQAAVLWGRCYDGDGAPAYWPWVQIIRAYSDDTPAETLREEMGAAAPDIALVVPELRQHLPGLPASIPTPEPEQARFRLFDGVTSFLGRAAARRPLVLVLDDLQWADRSSLLLLEFLAEALRGLPILVIGTHRDTSHERRHPLGRTVAKLSRDEAGQHIQVTGFSRDDVARFSELTTGHAAPAGLIDAIYAQTEGNPFFVREVVRLLIDEGRFDGSNAVRSWRITIPQGVRETIALRLDRLSATAYRVLSIASVAGREFNLTVLERVCGLPSTTVLEGVEEALAAGAVVERTTRPGDFRFSHALIQQTLYEEISRVRRVGLHRQIAETIEHLYAANLAPWLDALAWHFFQARSPGETARAIEYLTLAGAQAMDRVAYAEAADHYAHALEVLESEPGPAGDRRCEMLLSLGDAQKNAGDTEDAGRTFERAVQIARDLNDPTKLARAAIGVAESVLYSGFWYEGLVDLLDEALAALGEGEAHSRLRVQVMSRLVMPLADVPGSGGRVQSIGEQAVEIAGRIGDPSLQALAVSARLVANWSPLNIASRSADADAVVEFATRADDARLLLVGHAWRIFVGLERGDIAEVDHEIESYGRIADRLRLPHHHWAYLLRQSMRMLMQGRFAEGEELSEEALIVGTRPVRESAIANHVLQHFVVEHDRGGLDSLVPRARELAADYPGLPIWRCLLALLDAASGDLESAREQFEQFAANDFDDLPRDVYWLGSLVLLAEVCVALGDHERARRLIALLQPFADRHVSPGTNAVYLGPVTLYLGSLWALLDNAAAAERAFSDAEARAEQIGARPFVLRARLGRAQILARRNGGSGGRTLAEEVLAGARELGMDALVPAAMAIIDGRAG